jgi:Ribonuclease G/E
MAVRRLYIDTAPGERRGVVTLDGRPERLLLERQGEAGPASGEHWIGRVRRMERGLATGFIDLSEGPDGVLTLTGDALRLAEGAAVAVEIASPARRGKGPVVRFLGLAEGPPHRLAAAPTLEAQLKAFAPGQVITTGDLAREVADMAQAQVLATDYPLPGGGSIAIETTRALTAVDVDLGGRGGSDPRRAMRQANVVAIAETARLLRLKGLGGLVVLDLIGKGQDGEAINGAVKAGFEPDQPGVVCGPISRFGTLELALPRRQAPMIERLCDEDGAPTAQTLALTLLRMAEREGRADPGGRLTLICSPAVAAAVEPLLPLLAGVLGPRYEVDPFVEPARPATGFDFLDVKTR